MLLNLKENTKAYSSRKFDTKSNKVGKFQCTKRPLQLFLKIYSAMEKDTGNKAGKFSR